MSEPASQPQLIDRFASLTLVLEWGLGLRVLAADLLEWFTQRKGVLCVFPDSLYYWILAGTIRDGSTYEVVEWADIPHFALRTPGYPLFLAACRALFGDRPLTVRLMQAVLGVVSIWLVYRLTAQTTGELRRTRVWTTSLIAAALTAFDPYFVAISAVLLSEALFVLLMLASLWGLAVLWPSAQQSEPRRAWLWALGTGAASGAAILVRPSWALFVPAMLGTWMGASLYDGLNPHATGASDMNFLQDTEFWPFDEETQDALLRKRACEFARDNPGRTLKLALIKFVRYWSPWPNADSFRSPVVACLSALYTIPLFGLLALGCWDRRRDLRALVLLAGPLIYFCGLHLIFASSMRYRIPAAVPSMALAAIGLERLLYLYRGRTLEPGKI